MQEIKKSRIVTRRVKYNKCNYNITIISLDNRAMTDKSEYILSRVKRRENFKDYFNYLFPKLNKSNMNHEDYELFSNDPEEYARLLIGYICDAFVDVMLDDMLNGDFISFSNKYKDFGIKINRVRLFRKNYNMINVYYGPISRIEIIKKRRYAILLSNDLYKKLKDADPKLDKFPTSEIVIDELWN